jgi:hypothetical protein
MIIYSPGIERFTEVLLQHEEELLLGAGPSHGGAKKQQVRLPAGDHRRRALVVPEKETVRYHHATNKSPSDSFVVVSLQQTCGPGII